MNANDQCQVCLETYNNDFPMVQVNICECTMCIYCCYCVICKNRCLLCGQRNCHFFTFVETVLDREALNEMKNRFIRDYENFRRNNPNVGPLDLTNLNN